MTRLLTLAVLCLLLAAGLSAQGIGRSPHKSRNSLKKGANETAKEAQNAANKARRAENRAEAEEKREAAKEAKEAKKADDGTAAGPDIVLPEDGDDAVPEPGESVPRAEKDTTIDEVMDMLKLTDKTKREQFKKNVRDAWEDTEKEDKRYAPAYKRADTAEKKAAAKKEHDEKLKAIWDKSDAEIAKLKLLTEEQTAQWKKASAELRTKTATDIHYESKEKQAAAGKAEPAKPAPEKPKPEGN